MGLLFKQSFYKDVHVMDRSLVGFVKPLHYPFLELHVVRNRDYFTLQGIDSAESMRQRPGTVQTKIRTVNNYEA